MPPPRRLIMAALAVATVQAGACCGGSTATGPAEPAGPAGPAAAAEPTPAAPQPPTAAPEPSTTAPATAPRAASVLPSLVVDDVGTGTKVNLASLAPSAGPVLVWLWAPH